MASKITVKFVDAKGRPFKPDEENWPVVEIVGTPTRLVPAYKDESFIEIPTDVPVRIRPYSGKSVTAYPRDEIKVSPGETIAISYLREGEEPENVPISLFGGLLIGMAVATGAFALVRFVIKPKETL